MKIAVIVRGFHKHGGISRCAAEISERVAQRHEVHVFTSYYECTTNDLIYHRIKPLKISHPRRLAVASEFIGFALKSQKAVSRFDFDIIHAHSSSCFVQDIVTAHSCHKASLVKISNLKGARKVKFDFLRGFVHPFNAANLWIEKRQYKKGHFKKIIAVSNLLKQELIEFYGLRDDDITVISNGVDLEQFSPDGVVRSRIREKFGYHDDNVVISFVSHRFANKGLEFLIEAISLKRKKELRLLIVSGDDTKKYFELAKRFRVLNQIDFYGGTTQIQDIYRASDMFILPSLYEGFGLVILEAMAVGLPVITTKVGAAPELIVDGVNGFLVSMPPEPEEIMEKISILSEDEYKRKRMGETARMTALKYSWDNIASKTMSLYKSCL